MVATAVREDEEGRTGEGVVHAVVGARASRTKRLGVMVCASERAEEIESLRCGGGWRCVL